ncbi:MAG: hypothetical protein JJ855_04260 [Rhodospirillales bacterium]|nr:hypothetical protein [Rhodospirillales bacterium]
MLNKFSVLMMVFAVGGCAGGSGLVDRIEGETLVDDGSYTYKYAFLSDQQPSQYVLFSSPEYRRNFISDILRKKGYDVGSSTASLDTDKATAPGQSILIECGFAVSGFDGYLRTKAGEQGQTISCGAFDLFDGKKVYAGEADITPTMSSSVDAMSSQGIKVALLRLKEAGNLPGRLLTKSEVFQLLKKR